MGSYFRLVSLADALAVRRPSARLIPLAIIILPCSFRRRTVRLDTVRRGVLRDHRGRVPHAPRHPFLRHGAAQCGFCLPGMLVAAANLLARDPAPSEAAVKDAPGRLLCRCTGYRTIIEAVPDASAGGYEITHGLGTALIEEVVPGRTENLHDYRIRTIDDIPVIETIMVERPGSYGAKGVREPALIASAPAILSAG